MKYEEGKKIEDCIYKLKKGLGRFDYADDKITDKLEEKVEEVIEELEEILKSL